MTLSKILLASREKWRPRLTLKHIRPTHTSNGNKKVCYLRFQIFFVSSESQSWIKIWFCSRVCCFLNYSSFSIIALFDFGFTTFFVVNSYTKLLHTAYNTHTHIGIWIKTYVCNILTYVTHIWAPHISKTHARYRFIYVLVNGHVPMMMERLSFVTYVFYMPARFNYFVMQIIHFIELFSTYFLNLVKVFIQFYHGI